MPALPPPRLTKLLALIAVLLGAALMLPALVVACIALATWNAIAGGYAVVWVWLWLFGLPLVGLGILSWRRASERLRGHQG
jgi:hypothetical protein